MNVGRVVYGPDGPPRVLRQVTADLAAEFKAGRAAQREADAALVEGESGELALIVVRCARQGESPSQLVEAIVAHLVAKIRGAVEFPQERQNRIDAEFLASAGGSRP